MFRAAVGLHRALVGAALVVVACGGQAGSQPAETKQRAADRSTVAASPPACTDYRDLDPTALPPLPDSPYAATLEAVWRTVLDKHFDPTLGCLDWPALRLEYAAKLGTASDPAAAYALLNELLGKLGQSHFRVIPPEQVGDIDAPRGSARAPLVARWIADEVVVVSDRVGGSTGPIPRGAILLAIDDQPLAAVVARAKERAERPSAVAFEIARAVDNLLSGEVGATRILRYRDPTRGDAEVTQPVTCIDPGGELISLGNLRNVPTVVEGRVLPGTRIGYLAFNYWMLPMLREVEATLGELRDQGIDALILDLRGNPGGVGAMAVPLARMLLREGGSLGTLKFRDFEQEFTVASNPEAFTGPLVILIDEGTASTSEIFATGLRDLGRVQAIVGGRASAGAALPSLIERLADDVILQYVVGDYHSSKGTVAEGGGVIPDLLVAETRESFAAGGDPVLEAAIARLRGADSSATPHTEDEDKN